MRKYLLSLALSTLFAFSASSQLNVSFNDMEVDQNGNATVSVSVSDFTDLIAVQFSVNWDPDVFEFSAIENVTTEIPKFTYTGSSDNDVIGIPTGSSKISEGQIAISWFEAPGASAADGTVLFDLVLKAVGSECDISDIMVSDLPKRRELADINVNQFLEDDAVVSNTGELKISGTNCENGGGNDELTLTAPDLQITPGSNICVPITVENFIDIGGGQGSYAWDPTVLSFTGVANDVLGGGISYNESNVANGQLGFVYLFEDEFITLADDAVLVELCFDAIGEVGDVTDITFSDDLIEWDWTSNTVSSVPSTYNDGSVSVVSSISNPVIITIDDVTGDEGGQVCVDFNVDNFVGILGAQFTAEWDPMVLDFASAGGFNLPGLNANAFNESSDNRLRFQWNPSNGDPATLPDGSKLFHICYDIIGDCNDQPTSTLTAVDDGSFKIEFSILDPDPVKIPFEFNEGSVKVNSCGGSSCTVASVKDVSCNGGQDGAINVTVPTSNTACECVWKRSNGQIFQTLPVTSCNLIGAPADTYTLELTCGGNVECTITEEISEPAAMAITETISSVSCGNLGSISVESNGASPFTYAWTPGGETTKEITGLNTGNYAVVVTDANGCSATESYTVEEKTDPILITPTVVGAGCVGDNAGTISLAVLGGCPAAGGYTYNWDGPTSISGADGSSLAPGEYKVTVMDGSNPTLSATETIVVAGGTVALEINETTGSGSIALNIAGGAPNYGIVWTGPTAIVDDEANPTGLAEGTYNVTVTDAGGCVASKAIVVSDSGGPNFGSIEISSESGNNGFGVSCDGVCDATVSGSVASGTAPFTIQIVSDGVDMTQNVNNLGPFSVNALCAGSYQFTLTDATGANVTNDVVITTPDVIAPNAQIDCVNGDASDGSVSLNVTGGAGEYTYSWSNGSTDADINNLSEGNYNVVITDANNCQATLSALVDECPPVGCYTGLSIITPNGDQINDRFLIACVQSLSNSNLMIFNRYGQEVFSQSNYSNDWKGTNNNGELLREGSYLWVLSFESDANTREVFKGTVTLLRD